MRGNSFLSKLRYYVNKEILRTIYFALFHSYLTYVTIVWGQTRIPKKHTTVLQKKALRIMSFAPLILLHHLIFIIVQQYFLLLLLAIF